MYYSKIISISILFSFLFFKNSYAQIDSDYLLPFYELKNNEYKCGYINKNKQIKIPFKFLSCKDFKEGIASVEVENGKFSYIDTKGNLITKQTFDITSDFNNNKAIIFNKDRCSYLNKDGSLFSSEYYDYCSNFKYFIALVRKKDKYYFIDKEGKLFVDKGFDYALPFSYPNSTVIKIGNEKGVLTYWKKLVFDLDYKIDDMNSEGFFIISDKNEKYGYSDSFLTPIIKPSFDTVSNMKKGFAVVKLNNKFGMINQKGIFILKPEYDELEFFYNGMAYGKKDNKKGFVNWSGKFFEVKNMTNYLPFNEDLSAVCINNKWGFIDNKGNLIIKNIFDYVYSFQDGLAIVKYKNKWGIINKKGNWIIKNNLDEIPEYLPEVKLFKTYSGKMINYINPFS